MYVPLVTLSEAGKHLNALLVAQREMYYQVLLALGVFDKANE